MASVKTLNFLPSIFRTENNQKFLSATLDQLTQEPDFRTVNGYIGRKFAPTYQVGDNYITEATKDRLDYQLEPSVVVTNPANEQVSMFSSYPDLLKKISYYGGITKNHDRLFASKSYTFDGLFDYDKFVNFNNYYWLKDGPDVVEVFAGEVDNEGDYDVVRNYAVGGLNFSSKGNEVNPVMTLARGGTYVFNVESDPQSRDAGFWIQTEAGVTGVRRAQSNISTRDVLGVTNNGAESGRVIFQVPLKTAQDRYTSMPLAGTADFATTISYCDIQNHSLTEFQRSFPNGIDGITEIENLNNRTLIFVNEDIDDVYWTNPEIYDLKEYDYWPGLAIAENQRRGIWRINIVQSGTDYIFNLVFENAVPQNNRVFVRSGVEYATREFFVDYDGIYELYPLITANLDRLFYQDSRRPGMVGEIKLVDPVDYVIDVELDILGNKDYTSPNGVKFTNGLKVRFDTQVNPSSYAEKTYYVEGVGKAIRLVDAETLINPEEYATAGLTTPDYITVNRNSIDLNAWSRSNRWFHIDVIKATATYNKTTDLPDQSLRAARPIIEFEGSLRLLNHGYVAAKPIDILDFTVTDAFSDIEGAYNYDSATEYVANDTAVYEGTIYKAIYDIPVGVTPADDRYWRAIFDLAETGKRIIFAADEDSEVRNKIYRVSIIDLNDDPEAVTETVHLEEEPDNAAVPRTNFIIKDGEQRGKNYWYDGAAWVRGQDKIAVNQPPMYDIFDEQDISFANKDIYVNSSFAGTRIFSYLEGTGAADKVLGFPLTYKNFSSVGDIVFTNNFDTDSFTYLNRSTIDSVRLNSGYLVKTLGADSYEYRNVWTEIKEPVHQYQIISYEYTGSNDFELDVPINDQEEISYIKVFVNNRLLNESEYMIGLQGIRRVVSISSTLNTNDKIDISVYSDAISESGYYEVPRNLDLNAENRDFSRLTLGQIQTHVTTLASNTRALTQSADARAMRDMDFKSNGGSILQHASPAIYASMFLTDDQVNIISSLDYSAREYVKFKNKFLELAANRSDLIDAADIAGTADALIKEINAIKNQTFPGYYSDMVPYGDNRSVYDDVVINPNLKQFDIPEVFDDHKISFRAVLVYVNGTQLVKDKDYRFPQDRTAVIINDSYPLSPGDKIRVVEYSDTRGSYVPETPTKLGLYPKFTPEIRVDDTYIDPISVIVGHDGSIVPVFGDYRDDLLLELEKRIYNNIKSDFDLETFDFYSFLPGKFRSTDYDRAEFDRVLTRNFLKWAGSNRVDFGTNRYFESNNAWTWNYRSFRDVVDGEFLTGSWRSAFKYFYDTDRPHTHPWEMLGFSEEPSWWQERYGAAPYTGGNYLLWEDLSKGYIHAGSRQGIDPHFVRPQLLDIIPVDEYGQLKDPSRFLVRNFSSTAANRSFGVGEQGPAETAWRRSSDYPFAVQAALALTKPAEYFSKLLNIDNYRYNQKLSQMCIVGTNGRLTPATVKVHGDTQNGAIVMTSGYLNWIADYLRYLGVDPVARIKYIMDNVSVNLAYKMAGYTDKRFIKVLAEQSSPNSTNDSIIVPEENYDIYVNKSSPLRKAVYSAVIVEKTNSGYAVSGYDLANPYFTIIPSLANNNFYTVSVGGERGIIYRDYQSKKVVVPYGFEFRTRQQVVDFLVSYGRNLIGQGFIFSDFDTDLKAQKDWILSSREFLHWSQQGWKEGNLIVLSPVSDKIRFFSSSGVVDEIGDTSFNKVLDQNFNSVTTSQFSCVRSGNQFSLTCIEQRTICLAQLDVVQYEHVMIFDNITVFDDIIYLPELGNRQYRLKLVGRKTGSWTGTMEPPGFIYNNDHVDAWQPGRDYRKGSIVEFKDQYFTALENVIASNEFDRKTWQLIDRNSIKTGLLPNFAYNAKQFETAYDIDGTNDDLHRYSMGLIGFRTRKYLNEFGLDDVSQVKFYQGFIKEKGSKNAIDSLTSATFNNVTGDVDLYEEWAFRVGEYGAIDNNQNFEVLLDDAVFDNDPVVVQLLDNLGTAEDIAVGVKQRDLYKKTADLFNKDVFYARNDNSDYSQDILTAGYVNIGDVNATIFDIENYTDLDSNLADISKGYKIWVAKDFDQDWNVYRVNETNNRAVSLTYSLDGYATFATEQAHDFSVGDVIVVKNFDSRFNGFYQVTTVTDNYNFVVRVTKNVADLKSERTVTGDGLLFILSSMRVDYLTNIDAITPPNGWEYNDRVWVDSTGADAGWSVFEKTDAWKEAQKVGAEPSEYLGNDAMGFSVKINAPGDIVVAGAPGADSGTVKTFIRLPEGNFVQTGSIKPNTSNTSEYGYSVDISDYVMAVGAPGSEYQQGRVFVHLFRYSSDEISVQVIEDPNGRAGNRFGESVAISADSNWLFVGSPGSDHVFAYVRSQDTKFESVTLPIRINITTRTAEQKQDLVDNDLVADLSAANTYDLSESLVWSVEEIVVENTTDSTTLTLGVDYSLNWTTSDIQGAWLPETEYVTGNLVFVDGLFYQATEDHTSLENFDAEIDLGRWTLFTKRITFLDQDIDSVNIQITKDNILEHELGFVPESVESLRVVDGDSLLVAGRNYSVDGSTITFLAEPYSNSVNVQQAPYYKFVGQLQADDIVKGDKFGHAVKTSHDGSEIVISAPLHKVSSSSDPVRFWNLDVDIGSSDDVGDYNLVDGEPFAGYQFMVTVSGEFYAARLKGNWDSQPTYILGDIVDFGGILYEATDTYERLGDFSQEEIAGSWKKFKLTHDFTPGLSDTDPNKHVEDFDVGDYVSYDAATGRWVNTTYKLAGTVYKFRRRVEKQRTRDGKSVFIASEPVNDDTTLWLNSNRLIEGTDYVRSGSEFILSESPDTGQIVSISTTVFDQEQRIQSPEPQVGSKFGTSIAIDSAVSSIYVGAPGYQSGNYRKGKVYRFVSHARYLGIAESTAVYDNGQEQAPVVTVGDNLYINGLRVDFTGTTVDAVIRDIRNANIPGISASKVGQHLLIESSTKTAGHKLVLSSSGSAIGDLRLPGYKFEQEFKHQDNENSEVFGYRIEISDDDRTIMISSDGGYAEGATTFDLQPYSLTQFEGNATKFIDRTKQSGAVYLFESLSDDDYLTDAGTFVYAQRMSTSNPRSGDAFGQSVDIGSGVMVISSPGNDSIVDNGGILSIYNNDNKRAWNLKRQQTESVDLDSVNRLLVYSVNTQAIISNLDFIDPVKGKILGVAEQDIDFKTSIDPAIYSVGDSAVVTVTPGFQWGRESIGKTWWDLDAVRYLDYEQGNLEYRSKNWAMPFPGSEIAVYEWVESTVPPARYTDVVGDGEPKDLDTYAEDRTVDDSGTVQARYYFWVKNKKNVNVGSNKKNSVYQIADMISNPGLQSIPYAALLRSDSVALYGLNQYINGQDTVLQVGYGNVRSSNIIHTEFELVQEGNANSVLPQKIIDKMVDSLAGIDRVGNVVPDPRLNDVDKLGISIRPRQTMVRDRARALKNLVKYINSVFVQYPIANQYNISRLLSSDPIPEDTHYDFVAEVVEELDYINTDTLGFGDRVLVKTDSSNDGLWTIWTWNGIKFELSRIQAYRTDGYWEYIDWYATDYDSSSKLTFTVDLEKEIAALDIAAGDTIKVKFSQRGNFTVYRVTDTLALEVVGIENGTIQINANIYDLALGGMGFDSSNYDIIRFDKTPSIEIRRILEAIQNDIFVGDLKDEFNRMFFVMVNYILSEQKNVDWVFKTSFVNIIHRLRKLEQYPNYIRDNQDYYLSYIDEVKPYRTQVREYLIDYSGSDTFYGDVTDFDLPAYYDAATGTYRSPNGEKDSDADLIASSEKYRNWRENVGFEIDSILIEHAGQEYTLEPQVEAVGGGGSGAILDPVMNFVDAKIASIQVTESGSGYTSTPTILINGNGTDAKAYPVLKNERIRRIKSVLRFDRTAYESRVKPWQPNSVFWADIVVYNNEAYEPLGSRVPLEVSFERGTDVVTLLDPSRSVDVRQGQRVFGPGINRDHDVVVSVDSVDGDQVALVAQKRLVSWESGQPVEYFESVTAVVDGSEAETVYFNNPVTSSYYFDYNNFDRIADEALGSALDRVTAYYTGGKSPDQLISGITYPGVKVQGVGYLTQDELNKESMIDTAVQSYFRDSALGNRPEDINIDGGGYVDTFNSHAPEELVPGITFDTLNMQVFTTPLDASGAIGLGAPYGYRGFHNMLGSKVDAEGNVPAASRHYYRISEKDSTFLTRDLALNDTVIYVEDASKLPAPGGQIFDGVQGRFVAQRYGEIFINGEKIIYYTRDLETNTLRDIRRGVDGTGAAYHSKTTTTTMSSFLIHQVDGSVPTISRTYALPEKVEGAVGYYIVQLNKDVIDSASYTINEEAGTLTIGAGVSLIGDDLISVQFIEIYERETRVVDVSVSQIMPIGTDTQEWLNTMTEFGLTQVSDFDLINWDTVDTSQTALTGVDIGEPLIRTFNMPYYITAWAQLSTETRLEYGSFPAFINTMIENTLGLAPYVGNTDYRVRVDGELQNTAQLTRFPDVQDDTTGAWLINGELWAWDGAKWRNYGEELLLISTDWQTAEVPTWKIISASETENYYESRYDGYVIVGSGENPLTPQSRFLRNSLAFRP